MSPAMKGKRRSVNSQSFVERKAITMTKRLRIRNTIRLSLAALLFLAGGGPTYSQIDYNGTGWGVDPMEYSRAGTAGWQFLKLPAGARSMAMGGVRSSIGYGNAGSAFTNPASAADVRESDLQFSTMNWVADIRLNSVSAVTNAGEWGCIGVNLLYLDYGSMVRTEIGEFNGVPGVIAKTEGLGTFDAHDLAVGLLYARRITDRLLLGGTLRYLNEQIDDASTETWCLDIGTMYTTGLGSLRISMLGRNFGPDAEFSSYDGRIAQAPARIRLPMMLVLGAAYDILEESAEMPHRLTVAGEYVKPNDGPEKVNLGAEYFFYHYFSLRGGYRFNYDEETFTFGFGAEYAVADDVLLQASYAYADAGRFNSLHMFTIGIGF